MNQKLAAYICVLAALSFGAPAMASAQASYGQYLVIIDDSGSMDQSDPRHLVVMASLALAAGLEDGDQVMLAGLNELARGEVAGPRFVSPRVLLAGRDGAEGPRPLTGPRPTRLGAHRGNTPCRDALDRAKTVLNAVASAGAPQTLLLLTDGACSGSVARAADWLQDIRSAREDRFRFVLLMREGRARPDRRLLEYARRTGWEGEASVSFDARALLRAFADVLSFSRGLRYDDGGRVGLERTFAGARAVRSLAISEQPIERIGLERVARSGATPITGGPTFRELTHGWSFRVASGAPSDEPFAVRSGSPGVEVLVIPVYGRLTIEAVVGRCNVTTAPPFPWTTERAVRAGQPACAWARLVGDGGETIMPGSSFEFEMELCDDWSCETASAMQPSGDGTFNAQLGSFPEGRHERAFRARGGALAFPVKARRGFASVTFGIHQVTRQSAPSLPIESVELGELPKETSDELGLVVRGSYPAGTRAALSCDASDGAASACLRCELEGPSSVTLQDQMNLQVRVTADPFCDAVSGQGDRALPFTVSLRIAPDSAVIAPYVLPIRGALRYANAAPVSVEVVGGSETSAAVVVPGPLAQSDVSAEVAFDKRGLNVTAVAPGTLRANAETRTVEVTLNAEASDCCSPGTYEGVLSLRTGESVGHVPVSVTVTDPGWWICPGKKILRWLIAVLFTLLLIWVVRGFLTPAKFRDGSVLLYAESHKALTSLRDGDDGWRLLKRFTETHRGFRKDATLHLGGREAPLPSLKRQPDDAQIVAQSGGSATLFVTGPTIERFTESKGWHELEPGEYPVPNKVTLRRGDEVYLQFRR